MKSILLLLLFFSSLFSSAQDCSLLPTGTYKAEFDTFASVVRRTDPQVRYEIFRDTCYIVKNGKVTRYNIRPLSKCSFQLKNSIPPDTSKLTLNQKAWLREEESWVYHITQVKDGIYDFQLLVGVHVRNQPGRFIRIKDL